MRIACPSCAAEYEVPASRLTPGRKVRCTRCGEQWAAIQEAEEAPPPAIDPDLDPDPTAGEVRTAAAAPAPTVTAMDRLAAPAPPPPRSIALVVAWVATFVVLGAVMVAAVVWRGSIVRAWPSSAWILGTANPVVANPGVANPGVANPGVANPIVPNPDLPSPGQRTGAKQPTKE
jgi:predicted Zn finger-like uncharacterized protein